MEVALIHYKIFCDRIYSFAKELKCFLILCCQFVKKARTRALLQFSSLCKLSSIFLRYISSIPSK